MRTEHCLLTVYQGQPEALFKHSLLSYASLMHSSVNDLGTLSVMVLDCLLLYPESSGSWTCGWGCESIFRKTAVEWVESSGSSSGLKSYEGSAVLLACSSFLLVSASVLCCCSNPLPWPFQGGWRLVAFIQCFIQCFSITIEVRRHPDFVDWAATGFLASPAADGHCRTTEVHVIRSPCN